MWEKNSEPYPYPARLYAIETYGGLMTFNKNDCWYLDATYCTEHPDTAACRDCFDFEATLVMKIGNLLGLNSPDKTLEELPTWTSSDPARPYPAPSHATFYHSLLAAGQQVDAAACHNPWAFVVGGVPDGATV